jgi:hypothetical protein
MCPKQAWDGETRKLFPTEFMTAQGSEERRVTGKYALVDVVWRNGPHLLASRFTKIKKAAMWPPTSMRLLNLADFFQSFLVYIKIGVHVLYVVLVFQGFQQANHGVGG